MHYKAGSIYEDRYVCDYPGCNFEHSYSSHLINHELSHYHIGCNYIGHIDLYRFDSKQNAQKFVSVGYKDKFIGMRWKGPGWYVYYFDSPSHIICLVPIKSAIKLYWKRRNSRNFKIIYNYIHRLCKFSRQVEGRSNI